MSTVVQENGVGGVRVYVCLEVEDAHTSTQYTSHIFHTSSYGFAKVARGHYSPHHRYTVTDSEHVCMYFGELN